MNLHRMLFRQRSELEDKIETGWLQVQAQAKKYMTDLQATLTARGKTHGDYVAMSEQIQELKQAARRSLNWPTMTAAQRETLDSIFLKVGRILTGSPDFAEHWHDIAGYATRMEEALNKEAKE